MFRLTHPLPKKCIVAVSGGRDSMAGLHFLMRKPERVAGVIHIHHSTGEFADRSKEFVSDYCHKNNLSLTIATYPHEEKTEEAWRNFRYSIFHSFELPVITGHHADDCLEEYVICMTKRGYLGTIPYQNKNVIRPFRTWKRESINDYVIKNNIPYVEDPTNTDTKYLRNKVRHEVIPMLLQINPGIHSLVEKAIGIQDSRNETN